MARSTTFRALWLAAFAAIGQCQYDPISDMCSRWDHQSVVKNNMLYIDGGTETFKQTIRKGKQVIGTNTYLIQVDLTQSWDWKTNISETLINKDANPSTGSTPPSLLRGAIYRGLPSDENLYIFGGSTSQLNSSFSTNYPDPSTYSLWSYNTTSSNWNQYDVSQQIPERPSKGAYAEAVDQGLGFYLGGQLSRGSSVTTLGLGNQTLGLQGMAVLNLTDYTKTRNLSTSFYPDAGVVSSTLNYVPGLGEKGILVGMGGTQISSSAPVESNGTMITFDSVNIFDINTVYQRDPAGGWYTQNTTGKIPPPRIDACSLAVAAPDNSSYNIYLYGGRDPILGKMYDDIYILSMPSFTWQLMYTGQSPRYGHTCHLVGNRQMITVGGSLNLNITSGCDWETKGVGIMDLSTKTWGSVYNAKAPAYQVTKDTVDIIGGTPQGGATLLAPVGGFATTRLKTIFFPPKEAATQSGTPSAGGSSGSDPVYSPGAAKKVSGGAIAGAVIGVLAGLALIAGLALFLIRRRRQANYEAAKSISDSEHEKAHELAGRNDYSEMDSQHAYPELGSAQKHELAAPQPTYELATGHEEAKYNSRKPSVELARSPSGDETVLRT